MTDDELIAFLGLDRPEYDRVKVMAFIAGLDPYKRAVYDRMLAIQRWDQGNGELPPGVIVCRA